VVDLGAYISGAVELAVLLVALGIAAARLRSRLVPGWAGAPARLAEAILAVGLLVGEAQVLGVAGLFEEWALVLGAVAIAVGVRTLVASTEGAAAPQPPPVHTLWTLAAVGVCAVVFAHWGFVARLSLDQGISNFDSLWYHMPFAARFAQDGSITAIHFTDPLFLNWFYPQNSELLNGVGLELWGRDTLSLFLNFGWLAVALIAGWCVGRPFGRGPHALIAVAIVLESHTMVVREPGAAKNDVMGAALVLASAALLITAWAMQTAGTRQQAAERISAAADHAALPAGALAIAGLAAGLAIGTKLTVAAMVAALTVAVFVLSRPGERRGALVAWWGPLLAGGGFWYARNLIVSGNPLPWVRHLGPLTLPGPDRLQEARPEFPIVHYATDTDIWRTYFRPELHDAFGALWPLVFVGAIAGAALVLWRGDRVLRALALVALFGLVAYLFTPLGAAGPEGRPSAFGINVRFAVPALLLGLALLPLAAPLRGERTSWALLAVLLGTLVLTDRSDQILRAPGRVTGAAIAALFVLIPAALWALHGRRRLPAWGAALGLGATALLVVVAAYPVQRDYLADRWRNFNPEQHMDSSYRWARGVSDSRIALAGTTSAYYAYGFYGDDLSNRVRYLGRRTAHGGFAAIPTCAGFRRALGGEFDYLVTAPYLNFNHPSRPLRSPEAGWVRGDPAVRPVSRDGPVTVWRLSGRLEPAACGGLGVPTRYVPGPKRAQ
jgi:hypothetical protein